MIDFRAKDLGIFAVICFAFFGGPFAWAADIATVVASSNSSQRQTNIPITFGHVFGKGEVTNPNTLGIRDSGGLRFPTQVDAKAIHSDGSLRHAVLSTTVPDIGANSDVRLVIDESGSNVSGGGVTVSDLMSTDFDVELSVVIGGAEYSASARSLLQAGPTTSWISGPIVTEWHVANALTNNRGEEHPHLTARFYVRAYAQLDSVRVSVILENNWSLVPSPGNITYDATIEVQGKGIQLQQQDVSHYRQARWRRVFWWGNEPNMDIEHDPEYMARVGVVPTYDSRLRIPSSVLADMQSEWSGAKTRLMGAGLIYTYMPDGGGRPDIAPLPRWTARYLMTQDPRAKRSMVGTSEQAGSFGIHYRDKKTDLPISLNTYPNISVLGEGGAFPNCAGNCNTPYTPDVAHQPSLSFVPYIVSGDYFHLEELQFWANWNMFYWGDHGGSSGLLVYQQIRAQAWGLRTLGHAAYITPDGHPLKSYFSNKLANNLNWYVNNVVNNAPTPLGYLLNPPDLGLNSTFSTWMDDFFTWTVGHVANLGFSKASSIFEYKARFPVGRMTNSDYCWILASTYWTRARDQQTQAPFATWSEYKTAVIRSWDDSSVGPSFGWGPSAFPPNMSSSQEDALIAAECNSAGMANILGLQRGEMIGSPWSHQGYPSNLQPAVAIAAERNFPNADRAWAVFDGRSVKPDSGTYNYNISPQWAIVPATLSGGGPSEPGTNPPRVELSAAPRSVANGESSVLTWTAQDADSCVASGGWQGSRPASGSEQVGPLLSTTTFTMTCNNSDGSESRSVTVNVEEPAAPSLSFNAEAQSVERNSTVTLNWTSENADSCSASGDWSGGKDATGSEVVGPLSRDSSFSLLCTGAAGNVDGTVVVTVFDPSPGDPPPTVSISADPRNVPYGGSSTLTWQSTDADSCRANGGWSGPRSVSGSETVGPLTAGATFIVDCLNSGGSDQASVFVGVAPPASPTMMISANPATVTANSTSTITWSTQNADSCMASGDWSGSRSTSGEELVGPLNQDSRFTLNCAGAGGDVSETATVAVDQQGGGELPVTPPPTASGNEQSGGTGSTSVWMLLLLSSVFGTQSYRSQKVS